MVNGGRMRTKISNTLKAMVFGMILQFLAFGFAMNWDDKIWQQLNIYYVIIPTAVIAVISVFLEETK
jgi:hypothetical protein